MFGLVNVDVDYDAILQQLINTKENIITILNPYSYPAKTKLFSIKQIIPLTIIYVYNEIQ